MTFSRTNQLNEGDRVKYGELIGIIQAIEGDIIYVWFRGLGVIRFNRNGHPIKESEWAGESWAKTNVAARNTAHYKNSNTKIENCVTITGPWPNSWRH